MSLHLFIYLDHYEVKSINAEVGNVKRSFCWRRLASLSSIAISCGQHLSCYVWQLDLSMELRKLMSTASLSSCRRSCSERHRTLLIFSNHKVCIASITV